LGTEFCGSFKIQTARGHCCVPTFHRESDLKLGY
jgi:hypothetical protein